MVALIVLDGVFAEADDGTLVFHRSKPLSGAANVQALCFTDASRPCTIARMSFPRSFWRRARARVTAAFIAVVTSLIVLGCYELSSTTLLYTPAPVWTGTGTRSLGGTKYSVGLAGQDVHLFGPSPASHIVQTAPFLDQFGGPYQLKSYVQNVDLGFEETEFIFGNPAGRTDNLRLLFKDNPQNAATWVEPAGLFFTDQGSSYQVVQICELAASETSSYISADSPNSHVFMSFRARSTATGGGVGGVLEIQTDRVPPLSRPAHWWIRTGSGGPQVAIRRRDGSLFADECMLISVTSDPSLSRQYLAVGSKVRDEFTIFEAFKLWNAPLSSWRQSDSIRDMLDLVIDGRAQGSVDVTFLVVLWDGPSNRLLRHYTITNGSGSATPALEETLTPDFRFIESDAPRALGDSANLYTYGSSVQLRAYHKN